MTASARGSAAQAESEVPATPPFRGVRLRRRVVAAVLSGVLLTFCFPKYDLAALAWVALIPLMAAIEGAPPHRAFWLGGLAGTVGYIGILSWVTITMTRYGNLPFPVAWMVMLMLAAYLSLFTGVFCALVCRFGRQSRYVQLALAPFLWVALELARTHLLTGFPWAALGYTQYAALPVIQVADITGIYGVSFLIVLVNSALWGVMRDFIPAYARPHGEPGGGGGEKAGPFAGVRGRSARRRSCWGRRSFTAGPGSRPLGRPPRGAHARTGPSASPCFRGTSRRR